ncbi:MAG: LysE family translocator [Limnobacter sp.]|nr:LysE family translocator [Limnobacter sp.]
MPDWLTLASFFAASVLLALSPGPDNFYVLSQSATRGAKAGLLITLGLCTGLVFHTLAVSLGLAALLAQAPDALYFLRWVGAGYLFYLSVALWRSAPQNVFGQPYQIGLVRLYRKGIFLNLTNPKVSLFFLAFMPQFVNPEGWPAPQQFVLFGALFILSTLLVFGGFACLGGLLTQWLNTNPKALMGVNKVTALVLATVGWTVIWG